MQIPAQAAVESALLKQAVALSVIKQSAQAEKGLANILEQAAQNVPASATRGTALNIKA